MFLCQDAVPVVSKRSNSHRNMAKVPRDLNLHPVDDLVRRLNRLCWISQNPKTTGKLIQLGIQIGGAGVHHARVYVVWGMDVKSVIFVS